MLDIIKKIILLAELQSISDKCEVSMDDAISILLGIKTEVLQIRPRYSLKYFLSYPKYWWRKLTKRY